MFSKKFNNYAAIALAAGTLAAGGAVFATRQADPYPELKSTKQEEKLPNSGATVTRLHFNGDRLQPGKRYEFKNPAVIEGSVPEGVTIYAKGQITVTGNVGNNASLISEVPQYSHKQAGYCIGLVPAGGISFNPYLFPCEHIIYDGAKPPYDKDPVIVVNGKVGNNSSLRGGAGTMTKKGAVILTN